MSAGRLAAKNCWMHSNLEESWILVSEGEADFEACKIYGNGAAGLVSGKRGKLYITKCVIHDNCEGVLIQDTGSAEVNQCQVYQNRANGIFVGHDHKAHAKICNNNVNDNLSAGILIGNKRSSVRVSGNKEDGNKGLPPQLPSFFRERHAPILKHQKRIERNKDTIKKAMKEQASTGGIMDLFREDDVVEMFFELSKSIAVSCLLCGKEPTEGRKLSRCSKCREACYCSRDCEVEDWPRHEK
jgi:Right handed beta helix region/MYND finger